MPGRSRITGIVAGLEQALQALNAENLAPTPRERAVLRDLSAQLRDALRNADPVRQPEAMFDPSDPGLLGGVAALALVAQDRRDLSSLQPFYGSGVYAVYYHGPHPAYAQVAGTETPLYVGKAVPAKPKALTPEDQGTKLFGRLREHAKSISQVENLDPHDFHCRFLVVQSGWEGAAESRLIQLFRPVWNNETQVCYGLGKHGDDSQTRRNRRSPWDTLHPGRAWATNTVHHKSVEEILTEIARHFQEVPPFEEPSDLIKRFIDDLRQ